MYAVENNLSINEAMSCAQPAPRKKYAFDIAVYFNEDCGRIDAERFIEEGFLSSYGAKISVTMPCILAINNGTFKAALGIRCAAQALFIEQYIDQPIEQTIGQQAMPVSRDEIAEIGHLYSNAQKFTMPLFLTTAVSLFCNHYRYMVFAGTEHVLDLINRTGISHTFIADADQTKLAQSDNDWGTYYDTHPKVVAISLSSVIEVINANPRFCAMFEGLASKIANTTHQLERSL